MPKSFFALMVAACALTGCASIVEGTTQSIAIETPPTTNASCVLTSKEGSWNVSSPGAVAVKKSSEDIRVICKKLGWHDGIASIPSNFEGWTMGNLLIGGLIGLGVDAATGAINKYPNAFQVAMTPDLVPPVAMPPAASMPVPVPGRPGV